MNAVLPGGSVVPRGYAERDDARESFADRVAQNLSARLQRAFHGDFGDTQALYRDVKQAAAAWGDVAPREQLPGIRYRLRRDGYSEPLIRECLALCSVALQKQGVALPSEAAFAAAAVQLRCGVAAVADDNSRFAGMALAVAALAFRGDPVHVLTRSDERAKMVAQLLKSYLDAFGFSVSTVIPGMDARARREACGSEVVCSTVRELGLDYLRDRLQLGVRQGELTMMAARLAGDAPVQDRLILRGLHCAIVEDADLVMIDDARLPLVIAAEADQSRERLLYEQALELARALESDRDFVMETSEPELTEEGARRLAQLVSPLGGVWAARSRREELIGIALRALHEFVRDRDYRVVQGRVIFPPPPGNDAEEPTEGDEILQKLTEVKEGCALSGRRDVLARMSVPSFLKRYIHLAGVCSDVRATSSEIWNLYGVRVTGEEQLPVSVACDASVFLTARQKLDAITSRIASAAAEGYSVVIALRSQMEGQAILEQLAAAAISVRVVQGRGGDEDRQALESLEQPGAVVVSCQPAERGVLRVPGDIRLYLLVAELHDARRHVDQLCRVYAAQRCEMLLSLEDEVVKTLAPPLLTGWASTTARDDGELPAPWSGRLVRRIQSAMERELRLSREELLSRDAYLGDLLAFGGRQD